MPGSVHRADEVRDPLVLRRVGVGPGEQDPEAGDVGVARPDLLAVDDPLVAVAHGAGAQRRRGREPASGSLNSWHQNSSPASIGGQVPLLLLRRCRRRGASGRPSRCRSGSPAAARRPARAPRRRPAGARVGPEPPRAPASAARRGRARPAGARSGAGVSAEPGRGPRRDGGRPRRTARCPRDDRRRAGRGRRPWAPSALPLGRGAERTRRYRRRACRAGTSPTCGRRWPTALPDAPAQSRATARSTWARVRPPGRRRRPRAARGRASATRTRWRSTSTTAPSTSSRCSPASRSALVPGQHQLPLRRRRARLPVGQRRRRRRRVPRHVRRPHRADPARRARRPRRGCGSTTAARPRARRGPIAYEAAPRPVRRTGRTGAPWGRSGDDLLPALHRRHDRACPRASCGARTTCSAALDGRASGSRYPDAEPSADALAERWSPSRARLNLPAAPAHARHRRVHRAASA